MERSRVLLVGAGKIGGAIVPLLSSTGDYEVTVLDRDDTALPAVASLADTVVGDTSDPFLLERLARAHDAVVSATPFHCTPAVARAACAAGAHYFDLTEDVASTRVVKALAPDSTA